MPLFSNILCIKLVIFLSFKVGIICGIISTIVTLTPNALKKFANSIPIAPAPTITISFGYSVNSSASSEVKTFIRSILKFLKIAGSEPVAITISLPLNLSFPFSVSTSTKFLSKR